MRNPIRSTLHLRRVPYGEHVLGAPAAAVVVTHYADFESDRCRRLHAPLAFLMSRYARRVRFVFRHFHDGGPDSGAALAAEAAEAAAVQRNFWPFHDLLFAHDGLPPQGQLVAYAGQLGLDVFRFESDLLHRAHQGRVREHVAAAHAAGVRQSPSFAVNGRLLAGECDIERLQKVIGDALASCRSPAQEAQEAQTPAWRRPAAPGRLRPGDQETGTASSGSPVP